MQWNSSTRSIRQQSDPMQQVHDSKEGITKRKNMAKGYGYHLEGHDRECDNEED